jgi:hypothetical protein
MKSLQEALSIGQLPDLKAMPYMVPLPLDMTKEEVSAVLKEGHKYPDA